MYLNESLLMAKDRRNPRITDRPIISNFSTSGQHNTGFPRPNDNKFALVSSNNVYIMLHLVASITKFLCMAWEPIKSE